MVFQKCGWRVIVICGRVARDYKSFGEYMTLRKVKVLLTIGRSNPKMSTWFGATTIWGVSSKTIHREHITASRAEDRRCAD
jgi:hypothetical protein